jgi:GNAT superfamily N-acetyltransferase
MLERQTTHAWIAEVGGVPVGYTLCMLHHRAANPFAGEQRWFEIDQIAVDPGHRRRGIGRSLITTALASARAQGIRNVEVTSWAFNEPIHELLRTLGFAPKVVRFELVAPAASVVGGHVDGAEASPKQ